MLRKRDQGRGPIIGAGTKNWAKDSLPQADRAVQVIIVLSNCLQPPGMASVKEPDARNWGTEDSSRRRITVGTGYRCAVSRRLKMVDIGTPSVRNRVCNQPKWFQ